MNSGVIPREAAANLVGSLRLALQSLPELEQVGQPLPQLHLPVIGY